MGKYKKKPVVIEAFRLGHDAMPDWANDDRFAVVVDGYDEIFGATIETLEGTMYAASDDYIIKGVQGELYPCKPDIFEATYEAVDE